MKPELGNDGRVLISVSDTGVGLPAGKVDEIFSAFFTTKAQGSGMGLAISRSIVESMVAVCGPRRTTHGVQRFMSLCRSQPK